MSKIIEVNLKKIKDDGKNAVVQVTNKYDDGSTIMSEITTFSGCWSCPTLIGPCMPCNGHS